MNARRISKRRSTRDLNDRCYWRYISYDHSDVELYSVQCKNSSHLTYQEYLKHMDSLFNVYFHPNFKDWAESLPAVSEVEAKELLKQWPQHHEAKEYKEIVFNSVMVDDITFKILNQVVSLENVISYSFINNDLGDSNLMSLIDLIDCNPNLCKLSFNHNRNKIIRMLSIGNFKNIVYLSLKSNSITDKCLESLVENLTSAPSKLRYLDLHDNKITREGVVKVAKIIDGIGLEYLGLGKNQLKGIADMSPVLEYARMSELTEVQKEEHIKILNDKKLLDEMLMKRKKPLKRLLDLKVPSDVVQIAGSYFRVKKPCFTLISLIDNNFKQTSEELIPVLKVLNKKLEILLYLNKYSEETKQIMKQYANFKF